MSLCAGVAGGPSGGSLTPGRAWGAGAWQRVLSRNKTSGTCPRRLPKPLGHLAAVSWCRVATLLLWDARGLVRAESGSSTAVSDSGGCQGPGNLPLRLPLAQASPCQRLRQWGLLPRLRQLWAWTAALVSQAPETKLKPEPRPRPEASRLATGDRCSKHQGKPGCGCAGPAAGARGSGAYWELRPPRRRCPLHGWGTQDTHTPDPRIRGRRTAGRLQCCWGGVWPLLFPRRRPAVSSRVCQDPAVACPTARGPLSLYPLQGHQTPRFTCGGRLSEASLGLGGPGFLQSPRASSPRLAKAVPRVPDPPGRSDPRRGHCSLAGSSVGGTF